MSKHGNIRIAGVNKPVNETEDRKCKKHEPIRISEGWNVKECCHRSVLSIHV